MEGVYLVLLVIVTFSATNVKAYAPYQTRQTFYDASKFDSLIKEWSPSAFVKKVNNKLLVKCSLPNPYNVNVRGRTVWLSAKHTKEMTFATFTLQDVIDLGNGKTHSCLDFKLWNIPETSGLKGTTCKIDYNFLTCKKFQNGFIEVTFSMPYRQDQSKFAFMCHFKSYWEKTETDWVTKGEMIGLEPRKCLGDGGFY